MHASPELIRKSFSNRNVSRGSKKRKMIHFLLRLLLDTSFAGGGGSGILFPGTQIIKQMLELCHLFSSGKRNFVWHFLRNALRMPVRLIYLILYLHLSPITLPRLAINMAVCIGS